LSPCRLAIEAVSHPTPPTLAQSAALAERARRVFPGGVTSMNYLLPAGPVFVERAQGAYLFDLDGNRYVDFANSHSALLVGHDHPAVRAAVERQLARGTNFGLGAPVQVELAERLQARVPSLERLVLTDSATKASHYSVKLARAFTGRPRIAKFQGAYHGTLDTLFFGVQKGYGYGEVPGTKVTRPGVSPAAAAEVVLLQWNESDQVRAAFAAEGDTLAGLILEPVVGDGVLTPEPGFLELLRAECNRHGCLLIFDEAVTFGIGPGGAQGRYGVRPDLTCIGKVAGAGLPLAAVGGRADVLALTDPSLGLPPVPIATTYPGHPLACAAGAAQLDLLTPEAHARVAEAAEWLRDGVAAIAARHAVPLYLTTAGHLFFFHWNPDLVRTFAEHYACAGAPLDYLSRRLFEQGIHIGWHGRGCTSLAHTAADLQALLDAVETAVAELSATPSPLSLGAG
jgi:glutamate-1-semialdehyde 2,1-aminomutase